MSQIQPQTLEDFAKISGVGARKLESYGEQFLSEIRTFVQEQKLPVSLPGSTSKTTLEFYQQGLSVEEIAQKRSLTVSTIYKHFCDLIEAHQPIEINDFVIPVKQEVIVRAIKKLGLNSLKELKENLGESFSYEEIRLMCAWWRRENDF